MPSLARLWAAGPDDFDALLAPSAARFTYQNYKGEPNTLDLMCAFAALCAFFRQFQMTSSRNLTASGSLLDCLALPSGKSEIRCCMEAVLGSSARWGAEYLDLVVSRCGLDLLHIGRFLWWKGS